MRVLIASSILLTTSLASAQEKDKEKEKEKTTEINVVGSKETETAGSVHSIKKKALDRFKQDDPTQVFLTIPGVYARTEDGYGLRPNIGIRGGNSDRSKKVTLTEDGVLFGPAPYSAPAAYYFPIIGRMRGVRVTKGPAAIVNGPQTIGGAIDLLTEDVPTAPRGLFDFAYGSFGYTKMRALGGMSGDNFGGLIEGIHLGSSGFKRLDGGGDTGFLRREIMGKANWLVGKSEFGLKVTYSGETSNETYLGLTDSDFRSTPYRRYVSSKLDRMELNRLSFVATHLARVGDAFTITTNVYRHDYHRIWRKVNGLRGTDIRDVLANPTTPANSLFYGVLTGANDSGGPEQAILIGPNDRTFVSQGVQTVARYTVKGDGFENRLEYGTRIHYDSVDRRHTQDGFLMRGGDLAPDGRPTEVTADEKASTLALAMYVANALAFRRVVVTPGVRVEMLRSQFDDRLTKTREVGTERVFLPGIGTYVAVTNNIGLIAGVYRGYSPPAPGSTRITRAEDAINWEGGARWTSKHLRAEALGFFNDYRNLTDVCTFSNGCISGEDRQYDAGAVHVYGAESYVESEIKTPIGLNIPLRLSYTFTRTEFLSSFLSADPQFGDVKEGDELPYVPRHQLSAMVGAETKRWGVAAQALYIGKMRERAAQGDYDPKFTTDASLVFDVSGSFKVTKWLGVYLNVRNLTDQAYLASRRPFGARPGSPRTMMAGLKIDL
jgi:Fe(3+) dicitrate transport protein